MSLRTPRNRAARAADIAAKLDGVSIRTRRYGSDRDDKSSQRQRTWKNNRKTSYR